MPSVTVYRATEQDIVKWMRTSRFPNLEGYYLRRDLNDVSRYDRDGKIIAKITEPTYPAGPELEHSITVNHHSLLQEARSVLRNDNLSLIVSVEDHAGASAADHSNFVIICRRMLIEAEPADLRHFYVVESRQWECRVTGIYADVGALSSAMQDAYIDRYRWLANGWPLNSQHHLDMLADRLVRARSSYVTSLLHACGNVAHMSDEIILTLQSRWMIAPPGAKYRFAQQIASTLRDGILLDARRAECFTDAIIKQLGAEAIKDFKHILR